VGICLIASTKLETAQAIFNGCAYVLLSVAILIYGWKLKNLIFLKNVKIPFLKHRYSLFILTVLLSFIFTIRAIWNFILAVQFNNPNFNLVPILYFGCPCPKTNDQIIISSLLILWDIIPSAVMIGIFWKIPKAKSAISPGHIYQPPLRSAQYFPVSISSASSLVTIDTNTTESEVFIPSPSPSMVLSVIEEKSEDDKTTHSIQSIPPNTVVNTRRPSLSRNNSKRASSLKISKGSPYYD